MPGRTSVFVSRLTAALADVWADCRYANQRLNAIRNVSITPRQWF